MREFVNSLQLFFFNSNTDFLHSNTGSLENTTVCVWSSGPTWILIKFLRKTWDSFKVAFRVMGRSSKNLHQKYIQAYIQGSPQQLHQSSESFHKNSYRDLLKDRGTYVIFSSFVPFVMKLGSVHALSTCKILVDLLE